MTDQSRHIRSPFKFLDPYGREDRDIFFGRTQEVETLFQFVNKNRLVLVYGQSGTGKTSLVQCGLANRFEVTDWVPFFVRRGKDINDSLYTALSQSKAMGGSAVDQTNLLPSLERISARYVRPLYLIFDQFEELLILGEQEEQQKFLKLVSGILNSPQTYELAHDTLAGLIDEERTEEEKHLNQIRSQIRSSYHIFLQTEEYLSSKQLFAYEDFISELNLEPELLRFVEDSRLYRRAEEEKLLREARETAQKERNLRERAQYWTRAAAIVSIIALVLAAVAIKYSRDARISEMKAITSAEFAEEKKIEAEDNLRLAQEKTQLAVENAKKAAAEAQRVNDERDRANSAAARAEAAAREANQAKGQLEIERKNAISQKDTAERALVDLKQANAKVVELILDNAREDMQQLEYEKALDKINAAAGLNAQEKAVRTAYQEVLFWFGESGAFDRVAGILDTAKLADSTLIDRLRNEDPAEQLALFRSTVQQVDPDHYRGLQARYYPDMVDLNGFQLARTETTVWQYGLYCSATGKDINSFVEVSWGVKGDYPVIKVNWMQAVAYCNWLSRQWGVEEAVSEKARNHYVLNLGAERYRLPTEGEWGYAAGDGQAQGFYSYAGSNDLQAVGWFLENSSRTNPVAGKDSLNQWGIYDLSGNVWEWCWDWFGELTTDPSPASTGPELGRYRVLRGGAWNEPAQYARVTARRRERPSHQANNVGFRVARTR